MLRWKVQLVGFIKFRNKLFLLSIDLVVYPCILEKKRAEFMEYNNNTKNYIFWHLARLFAGMGLVGLPIILGIYGASRLF